jgi:hypothetical protein
MKNYIFLVLSLLIVSCGNYQYRDNYYYLEHRNDNNQCFYVVDTINIPNPILVKEKGDYFIVSRTAIEKGTKNIEKLFHETDVYIAGLEEFFFYKYLSKESKVWSRYVNKVSLYSETEQITINGKTYEKFKSPNVSFILGLIKVNYYNTVMETIDSDWYMLKNREYKNSYYRIVFPILNIEPNKL